VGACASSLRETRGTFEKEDSRDGWWKGERSHDCRVSGLLEQPSGADGPQVQFFSMS